MDYTYYAVDTGIDNYRIRLNSSCYYDGGLAIIATCDTSEPFAALTVNLPESRRLKDDEAFVDTNNCDWAPKFLESNQLATPTGQQARSGFCTYPVYKFNLDKIPSVI